MRWRWLGGVVMGLAVMASGPVWAGSESDKEKPGPTGGHMPQDEEAMKQMMEAWAKMSAPGEYHEYLRPLIGHWRITVKWWMNPGEEPKEVTGSCVRDWILGGRFVTEVVSTPAFFENQPDFEGFGLVGYDKLKKRYHAVWADNISTMFMISTGTVDESRRVFTFEGTYNEPFGGETIRTREVLRIINDERHVMEFFEQHPGMEETMKTMEIVFERK